MIKAASFNKNSSEYDIWYTENQNTYASELKAVECLIPQGLQGVEIGIGTGRFAKPLGITIGVEPSRPMAEIAKTHGINVLEGVAEQLPIEDCAFDYALMVTAICFFDDVKKAFQEAYRVISKKGFLIVAFIDKESDLGILYEKHKQNNVFYRNATFYSVSEVTNFLSQAGFQSFEYRQTVYSTENTIHEVKPGYGSGSFVVVKAIK